jgi:amidase
MPILAGPDGLDPYVPPVPFPDYRKIDVPNLRIAFFTDNGIRTPTPETKDAVLRAAGALTKAGVKVDESRPPRVEETWDLFATTVFAELPSFERLMEGMGSEPGDFSLSSRQAVETYRQYQEKHGVLKTTNHDKALGRWTAYQFDINRFMEAWDALILPAHAYPAMLPNQPDTPEHLPADSYAMMGNLLQYPGVVVRGGTSPEGLPVGVQVLAPKWREDTALAVADYLEKNLDKHGGWKPSPVFGKQ